MQTTRRGFIKNTGMAIAGTAFLPELLKAAAAADDHILGLQLYTLRDEMKKDPAGTLKQIAAVGYQYVEHAGYHDRKFYGYTVADFKKLLADNGLRMWSGHSSFGAKQWDNNKNDLTDEWKNTFDDAAAVGMKYVISPGVDERLCKSAEDYKKYMEGMNKSGAYAKNAGLAFGFHNESYEFANKLDNKLLYDLLLEWTDPSLVAQQIDIGNMYEPGGRAMDYLKKYPGRFMLMHVKDEIKKTVPGPGEQYESTILGKGILPVKEIVELARKNGLKHFIIEQESYQGKSPLESAAEDIKMMKSWGV